MAPGQTLAAAKANVTAPIQAPPAPAKKQVFYFDGEDMVKRDAMVQLEGDYDISDRERAEYPFNHVHTEDGENVDIITREPVNILRGYAQQPGGLAAVEATLAAEDRFEESKLKKERIVQGYVVQENGFKRVIAI